MERLTDFDLWKSIRYRLYAAVFFTALFGLIAYLVMTGRTEGFDSAVSGFALSTRNPVTEGILIPITYLASPPAIIAVPVIFLLIPKTRIKVGLAAGQPMLVTFLLYAVLKPAFARQRPDEALWLVAEHGFSFPSGHSMNGLMCYGIMIFMLQRYCHNKRIRDVMTILLAALIPLIGWSRIFVGVHYPSDVLGGFAIGTACLMLMTACLDAFYGRKQGKASVDENSGRG